MGPDKPLTDKQEEALIALAELVDGQGWGSQHEAAAVHRRIFLNAIHVDSHRMEAIRRQQPSAWGRVLLGLVDKGLVLRAWEPYQAAYKYTLTEAGKTMLASMGD